MHALSSRRGGGLGLVVHPMNAPMNQSANGAQMAAARAPVRVLNDSNRSLTRIAALQQQRRFSSSASSSSNNIQQQQRRTTVVARAEEKKRGVRGLEDFVIGGPKLRKWYGQGEDTPTLLPRDGGGGLDAAADAEEGGLSDVGSDAVPRDVVLVTDGESAMAEQVVLQLILARAKVRMIVNDVAAAKNGFGPYVEAVSADVVGGGGLPRALRGVRAVVALGRLGRLLPAAKQAGVEAVVMPSTAGMPQPGGLAALFGGGGGAGDGALKDAAREQQLAAAGVAHVVVKAGPIRDAPGGASALALSTTNASGGGGGGSGGVCREDLAAVVARLALDVPLPPAAAATVYVSDAGPGAPPEDWAAALAPLVAAPAAPAAAV